MARAGWEFGLRGGLMVGRGRSVWRRLLLRSKRVFSGLRVSFCTGVEKAILYRCENREARGETYKRVEPAPDRLYPITNRSPHVLSDLDYIPSDLKVVID